MNHTFDIKLDKIISKSTSIFGFYFLETFYMCKNHKNIVYYIVYIIIYIAVLLYYYVYNHKNITLPPMSDCSKNYMKFV